jgi:hypothetical protein
LPERFWGDRSAFFTHIRYTYLMESYKKRRYNFIRQTVGILFGAGVGYLLAVLFPTLAERVSLFSLVLICAALGGVIASLEGFTRAGAAPTHRENPALNLLVGLGLPALLFLVLFLIFR